MFRQLAKLIKPVALRRLLFPAQGMLAGLALACRGLIRFEPARIDQNARLLHPARKSAEHGSSCLMLSSSYFYHNA